MSVLASNLRKQLENVCIQARDRADEAARSALQRRAVHEAKPFAHFSDADKSLRRWLRARGKQAGDVECADKTQSIEHLTQELAYEYWHRMLFARFLAENHLLMHPDGVAVSLEECEELARSERAPNGYVLAARYASRMLPQIFRIDDVLLEVEFAPEHRLALEKLLAGLPRETFLADDSLGWVYQFWQTKRKDEVNKSGEKIDGRTLPAVTQLFTEDYMVQFLLHNTIGASWCARQGITGPPGGAGVPAGKAPVAMEYLRWEDDGTPAACSFDGWPKSLKKFTMLDPCCGSGHFLVAGFRLLVPLRMHDEKLTAEQACEVELRDNLFGLELDARCTQIAAFALALAAWTYLGPDGQSLGYRLLPTLNIACSGQGVVGTKEEWVKFASGDGRFREGMERLYDLFQQAPDLGSLLDPRTATEDLFALGFDTLRGTVERALKKLEIRDDPDQVAPGVAAQGIALAASMMSRQFALIATNVPYLAQRKQGPELRAYIHEHHGDSRSDVATSFLNRCSGYCHTDGTLAVVSPQNWWFLSSYTFFRQHLLKAYTLRCIASLGEEAWQSFGDRGPNAVFLIACNRSPELSHSISALDVAKEPSPEMKGNGLRVCPLQLVKQTDLLRGPDSRIVIGCLSEQPLLENYAIAPQGVITGDIDRWRRCFWELQSFGGRWNFFLSTVTVSQPFGGREHVIDWGTNGEGMVRPRVENLALGKAGVAVSQMRDLTATLYTGERFDNNIAVIVPHDRKWLVPLWAFVKSQQFYDAIRLIDKKVNVTNATFLKIPFDSVYWSEVGNREYPEGLPGPGSDDPTQWLFIGEPTASVDPLHVAVARLLGYRWPDQEPDDLDPIADADGIVPIPSVRGESPATERLREVLKTAFGSEWSASLEHKLLAEAGTSSGMTLDDWLRNGFFEQHCKQFHQRPFIWHIWDGRKDGFSCLVNYHKLTHKLLDNLTYSYVQDWINIQTADSRSGKTGGDLRLAAAQAFQEKLKLILAGEPPYDIFVRWKPLSEQPIGWNPDLNDGVRMNIRPFVQAGILRKNPNIKWTKDRGKDPKRDPAQFPWFCNDGRFIGDRVNDIHLTNADKHAARKECATRETHTDTG